MQNPVRTFLKIIIKDPNIRILDLMHTRKFARATRSSPRRDRRDSVTETITESCLSMAALAGPLSAGDAGVPTWLVGVWERRYIQSAEAPDAPASELGPEQSAVTVRYLQAPRLFCVRLASAPSRKPAPPHAISLIVQSDDCGYQCVQDIRVPEARAAAPAGFGGVETATAAELTGLLAGRGGSAFAGLSEVWRRDSDGEERVRCRRGRSFVTGSTRSMHGEQDNNNVCAWQVHWHAAFNYEPPSATAALWPQIESGRCPAHPLTASHLLLKPSGLPVMTQRGPACRHTTSDIGRVEHKEVSSAWQQHNLPSVLNNGHCWTVGCEPSDLFYRP